MTPRPVPAQTGQELKAAALERHERRHSPLIRNGQRVLARAILEHGFATADDIRDRFVLPTGVNPKALGAVPVGLAKAGLIEQAGFTVSRRPEAHRRPVAIWRTSDPDGLRAWLASHPELTLVEPSPTLDSPTQQRLPFDEE